MKIRSMLIVAADPAVRVSARQALGAHADALFECPLEDLHVHASGLAIDVAVLIGASSRAAPARLEAILNDPATRIVVGATVAAANRAVLRLLRSSAR